MDDTALINSLKDSAVDAWVVTESGYQWILRGSEYVQTIGTAGVSMTRPSGGAGGGVVRVDGRHAPDMTASYQEGFEQVRSTIDSILAPWMDIPNDEKFISARDTSMASVKKYGSGITLSDSGGINGTNPALTGPLTNIGLALSDMSGGAIRTMEQSLLAKLSGVINALSVIAQLRRNGVIVQRSIWSGVNRKLPEILQAVAEGMQAIAAHNTASLEKGLGQFAYLIDIASVIPGAVGRYSSIANKLIKVTKDSSGSDDEARTFWHPAEAGSYSALINDLSGGLKNLNDWVAKRESRLAKQINGHMIAIRANQGEFDLRVPEVSPTGTELTYNPEVIEELIVVELPALAAELATVAETNSGCLLGSAANRPVIGLTPSGATPEIDELTHLLRALTIDLSGEVAQSAITVRTVLDDMIAVEQSAMDVVARYLAELDQSRVKDPLISNAPIGALPPLSSAIPGLTEMMTSDETH